MKFLVDAQLPARLARLLNEHGHDATHTSELPNGNRTPDDDVAAAADAEGRVVITKDRDFRYSHFVKGTPLWRYSDSRASRSTPASPRSEQHRDRRLPKPKAAHPVAPTTSSPHPHSAAAVPALHWIYCANVP